MKTNLIKQIFLLFSFCITSNLLFAQAEPSEPSKPLSLNGFSMQIENYYMPLGFSGGLTKLRELAPNSNLLKGDFKNFNQDAWGGYYDYKGPTLGMSVLLNWESKNENFNKLNPKFRFGVSTYHINLMHFSMYREQHFMVDTLVSNRDGSLYYLDSVTTDNYDVNYSAQFIFVNAQLLIGSNPANRWRIYGGLGLSAGYSLNSQIAIYYYGNRYYDSHVNYYSSPQWSPTDKSEYYSGGQGFAVLVSVPIGIELRMSKTKQIWQNINLFAEGGPTLSFISFSNIGSSSNTASTFAFGLKYQMN